MSNMISPKIIRRFPAYFFICFLTISAVSHASEFISLAETEKKRIDGGDIIVREVETLRESGKTFEVIGYINAPKKTILHVLTEYIKYPEFMPNISQIQVVEKRGDESILNYTLTLPLGKIKKYRLKVSVTNPDNQYSVIQWELLDWPELKEGETIRDTTGYWRIEEKAQNISLVQYHVYTDPGPIPFGLGWIVDIMSKKSVPEAFSQTKSRAEEFDRTIESRVRIKAVK